MVRLLHFKLALAKRERKRERWIDTVVEMMIISNDWAGRDCAVCSHERKEKYN